MESLLKRLHGLFLGLPKSNLLHSAMYMRLGLITPMQIIPEFMSRIHIHLIGILAKNPYRMFILPRNSVFVYIIRVLENGEKIN